MTEEVMHPLRRRMLEDMTVRNLSEGTQQVYIRSVRACCRYCNKKPSELTLEGRAGLPPTPFGERSGAGQRQRRHGGASVLLPRDARAARGAGLHPHRASPSGCHGAERPGGGAPAGGGAGAEVADRAQRRLRGGTAGVGGGGAEARRHPKPSGCGSGWSRARGGVMGMRCSRPSSCGCCGTGGRRPGLRCGCSPTG